VSLNPLSQFIEFYLRTNTEPRNNRVTESVAAQIGHAESLLDVGCGDGSSTLKVAERVGARRVAGVDVLLRDRTVIDVRPYDGLHLPFGDREFEAVSLIDVLHHCIDPQQVLNECIRVASRVVVVKDHLAFGPVTRTLLYAMDVFSNRKFAVASPGTYFDLAAWVKMVDTAGARIAAIEWPLPLHGMPWRLVGWPELQFTAKILPIRN
jgi:ubiquinone/menaquinone biosynthesis C-methylase UbiE